MAIVCVRTHGQFCAQSRNHIWSNQGALNGLIAHGTAGRRRLVLRKYREPDEDRQKAEVDVLTVSPEPPVEAPEEETPISEEPPQRPGFERTKWLTFAAIFVGYACFYITRNSLNAVNPVMVDDPTLAFSRTQVGGLTSIMPVAYGFSKGISGFAGGKVSPHILLAVGLMATAAVNIAFGFGASYAWFLTFWAANGMLQGLGSPACARMITAWFPSHERGRFWSIWTASNNIGGFLAPIIAGAAAKHYGWRYGMYVPGIIGLVVGAMVLVSAKDSPEAAGYRPVEPVKKKVAAPSNNGARAGSNNGTSSKPKEQGLWQTIKSEVLSSPWLWLLAVSYFFAYAVRQGVTTWFIFFLQDVKGFTDTAQAARIVSGLELGGLVGSLSAGAISDYFIGRNIASGGKAGNVGLRIRVVVGYTVAIALALFAFMHCPPNQWMLAAVVAATGVALYGPQMLIGLCGVECVSQPAVSAANGLLGWVSYLGAAGAGVPLAAIVKRYGWPMFFAALIGFCAASVLLMLPMLNLRSYSQEPAHA